MKSFRVFIAVLSTLLVFSLFFPPTFQIAFAAEPPSLRQEIIKQITLYLNQFQNACFSKAPGFSVGDPNKYLKAINNNLNYIYIGVQGEARILKLSPESKPNAIHHTYSDEHFLSKVYRFQVADLIFPFDPRNIPAGEAGYKNRQTLMHEMTHHIEWIAGVKGSEKQFSERNTNYQDFVVNKLIELVKIENELNNKKKTVGKALLDWQAFEKNLREAEGGSCAGGNPPDADLDTLTGFYARFGLFEMHYLSGFCGDDLRDMAMISRFLPNIMPTLEITPPSAEIQIGQSVTVEASLLDSDWQEMVIPRELKAKYQWKLPDGKVSDQNPVTITLTRAGQYSIPVELIVTLNQKDHVIIDGLFSLTVKPEESRPSPIPGPSPKPGIPAGDSASSAWRWETIDRKTYKSQDYNMADYSRQSGSAADGSVCSREEWQLGDMKGTHAGCMTWSFNSGIDILEPGATLQAEATIQDQTGQKGLNGWIAFQSPGTGWMGYDTRYGCLVEVVAAEGRDRHRNEQKVPAGRQEGDRILLRATIRAGRSSIVYDRVYEWRPRGGHPSVKTKPGAFEGFIGRWDTPWGIVEFKPEGAGIVGTYPHKDGRIRGQLTDDGTRLIGTWSQNPDHKPPQNAGTVEFSLQPHARAFIGVWWYGDKPANGSGGAAWNGTRIE